MRLRSGGLAAHAAGAVGVVTYAWWATGRRPFTATATLAVVGAGLVAMTLGSRAAAGPPACAPIGMIGWSVLFVGLAGWQLLAFVQDPRSEHPTPSSLLNAALDDHPSRALAFVVWLSVRPGWPRR